MVKMYILPAVLFVLWLIRWWRRKMAKKYCLSGKTVMVTGSAAEGGLGMSLAIEARRRGAKLVIITGRKMAQLKPAQDIVSATPGVGSVEAYELDLDWSPEQLTEAVSHIWEATDGGIDVLINNAGCSYRGNILDTKPDVHHSLMQANYFGHVHVISEMARRMSKCSSHDNYIVGISSVQGKMSIPYRSAYSASKHAFQAFFDCLRAELSNCSINVLAVSPGYMNTNLSKNALRDSGNKHNLLDKTTSSGLSPETAAQLIMNSMEQYDSQLILAPWHHKLVIQFREIFPELFFLLMKKRALSSKAY